MSGVRTRTDSFLNILTACLLDCCLFLVLEPMLLIQMSKHAPPTSHLTSFPADLPHRKVQPGIFDKVGRSNNLDIISTRNNIISEAKVTKSVHLPISQEIGRLSKRSSSQHGMYSFTLTANRTC